jgi:hypothetical protein
VPLAEVVTVMEKRPLASVVTGFTPGALTVQFDTWASARPGPRR